MGSAIYVPIEVEKHTRLVGTRPGFDRQDSLVAEKLVPKQLLQYSYVPQQGVSVEERRPFSLQDSPPS